MKKKFLKLLNEYETKRKEIVNAMNSIDSSNDFTPEGKEKKKQTLKDNMNKLEATYSNAMNTIIDQVILNAQENDKKEMKKRMTDTSYQVGLSNIVKGIELGAYDEPYLQEIIEDNYSDDLYALKLINGAISSSNSRLIPFIEQTRSQMTIKYLNKEKEQVREYVEFGSTNNMVDIALVGMKDFIENNFDDSLNYIIK